MPSLTVEGHDPVEVASDRRLILAIKDDAGADILHACGGNARCTTCRVEILEGEPSRMTRAENEKLAAAGLEGVRLSCQWLCDNDMTVRPLMSLADSDRPDAGPQPEPRITPEPEWT